MVVFDSSGYCRIGSLNPAWAPTSRIRRLTTVASTGRLMKISVKRMGLLLGQLRRRFERPRIVDLDCGVRLRFELAAGDHRLACLDAFEDRDPVAFAWADAHETALSRKLLLGRQRRRGRGVGRDCRGDRLRRGCRWSTLRRLGLAFLHHPYT